MPLALLSLTLGSFGVAQEALASAEVLSMLMVLSHFDEGETNLTRHPQLLDLVRQNRWLEELSGTFLSCFDGGTFGSIARQGVC